MAKVETHPVQAPQSVRILKAKRFQTIRRLLHEPKAVVGFTILAIFLLIMIFAPLIAPNSPTDIITTPWQSPSSKFIFGTTGQGQDVFSQFIWGTRTSMLMGLGVGVVATVISVIIGIFAGYSGGKTDAVLNWIMYVMLVLPSFPLMLVVGSFVPSANSWFIMLLLALTSWPAAARVKRSQAMTFRNRDFVLAAKLSGVSNFRIMLTEVIPNMYSLIFNTFIGMIQWGIFGEAFLRFLGIGSTTTPSWGNMLNWAQSGEALLNGAWWWFVPPGLAMTIVILALTLINYGVDEVSNPKLAKPPKLPKQVRMALRKALGKEGGTA